MAGVGDQPLHLGSDRREFYDAKFHQRVLEAGELTAAEFLQDVSLAALGKRRIDADKVVGFGHQLVKALIPPPPEGPDSEAARPGPRIMRPASAAAFQALRARMETEWTPQMMQSLDIDAASLPIIWDADFLYGPRTTSGEDTYVLCEINVSSVFPFPEQAPAEIARRAMARLLSSKDMGGTKNA